MLHRLPWIGKTLREEKSQTQGLRAVIKVKHVVSSVNARASRMSKGMKDQRGRNRVARERKEARGVRHVGDDECSVLVNCIFTFVNRDYVE